MLQPKKTKYRKTQKGKLKGNAQRGAQIAFGSFAIKSVDEGFINARQIEAARILVESTELAAEAMQQGFELGTVTSVDVLNALRDQFTAERDLQRTRYEQITYYLFLKRETGVLTAEDMIEVGAWLEPASL